MLTWVNPAAHPLTWILTGGTVAGTVTPAIHAEATRA